MIYDCFTFFNELEILELRLNILYEHVDKFVIVEGNKTHTGKDKEFIFEQNKNRFEKFLDKITYIKVEDFPSLDESQESEDGNKWLYENYQRDAIMRGLKECTNDDIIITSDCDEIINPEALKKYKKIGRGLYSLMQYRFKYNYNTLVVNVPFSKSARICRYSELIDPKKEVKERHLKFCKYSKYGLPTYLRFVKAKKMKNAGWHFEYIGDIEFIKKKMNAIAEQQCNATKYMDNDAIKQGIDSGEDIIKCGERFVNLKIDKNFPQYFVENQDKYKENISYKNQISLFQSNLKTFIIKITGRKNG